MEIPRVYWLRMSIPKNLGGVSAVSLRTFNPANLGYRSATGHLSYAVLGHCTRKTLWSHPISARCSPAAWTTRTTVLSQNHCTGCRNRGEDLRVSGRDTEKTLVGRLLADLSEHDISQQRTCIGGPLEK